MAKNNGITSRSRLHRCPNRRSFQLAFDFAPQLVFSAL
jgi:hypothetical protein